MGIGAALYSGISGLTVHSERMTVIGNNLANVNTTGFKGSRMHFEDLLSQDYTTVNGVGQIGRGVRVSTIYSDYGQGAFEASTEATDMAISGNGFFIVSPRENENQFFTRAGNFRFDKDGYLADPHGYVLQGWEVEQSTTSVSTTSGTTSQSSNTTRIIGVPTDIRLENFQSAPKATSNISIVTNLDPSQPDKSKSTDPNTPPYFAMFRNWDGTSTPPIASTQYSYSSTIKVYDDIGTAHNASIYFDKVTMSNAGGQTVFEYMVTVDPAEDQRTLSGANGQLMNIGQGNTSAAGVLMIGTITFNTGQIAGVSAYTLKSNGGGNVGDLANWDLADFSSSGYPVCTANFLGKSNASASGQTNASLIQIDFGISNSDLSSNAAIGPVSKGWNSTLGSLPTRANAAQLHYVSNAGWLPSFKGSQVSALATQSFDTGGSSTLFQAQNGYTAGILQNVSVSRDGILTGNYSNGQVLELYSITLSTFTNQHGLRREGGNLFKDSRESGPPLTGQAGSSGKGTIDGNSLEMSNVDMSTEFVRMITTQRGFQANTKVITTTDSMLGEVIAMKR